MKLINILLFSIISLFIIYGCDDINIETPPNNIDQKEFVNIAIDATINNSNKGSISTRTNDKHFHDNEEINSIIAIPTNLSCRIYYDGNLISFVNKENPTSDIISGISYISDNENVSHFKINVRFIKSMDPSKIKIAFAGQSELITEITSDITNIYALEDPFRNGFDEDIFISNTSYGSNNYLGVFQLSQTNDWENIKTTFNIKNISTQIIIITDEFEYTTKVGTTTYMEYYASLDYCNDRDLSEYLNNYTDRIINPIGVYNKIFYNYFNDSAEILLNNNSLFNNGSRFILFSQFGVSNINYDYEEEGMKLFNSSYSPIQTYKGTPVGVICNTYFVFPHEFSNLKFTDDAKYLLKTTDANNVPKYIRIFGRDYYIGSDRNQHLIVDGYIPIPDGGFKQGYRYIIKNKPGTSFLKQIIKKNNDTRCTYNNSTPNTISPDDIIIEEYPMDEPLPLTHVGNEI